MPSFLFRALAVVVLALVAAACGSDPVTPIAPTVPTRVTETFSGAITVNGAATHPFTTVSTGAVTATLTALAPESTTTIGLALGTWNGVTCAIVLANDKAVLTSTVTGTVTSLVGNICVRIYDVGGISEETSYEVTVSHP